MGLLQDIRKRRLFQIVAAYAAAGFVALQGVDQLVQQEILPAFAYPLALWWYGVGFIGALVIGWFHGEKGAQKAPVSEIVVLSVLGVFLLGFTGARINAHLADQRARAAAAASDLDLRSVAVDYFEDYGGGDNQHIADGLTEDLISQLRRVRELDVVSRHGVEPFRGLNAPVEQLAREVEAGTVVTGGVEEVGDQLRIHLRLYDGESGTHFRRETLERPADELLEAREDVAEETARFLREWLGEEIRPRRREADTEELDAWRQVQRGETRWRDGERLVGEAGDAEGALEAMEEADELLARATELDPSWAEPWTLRARIAVRRAEETWDHIDPGEAEPITREGLAHAERALELDPDDARALDHRATLRYIRYLFGLEQDPEIRQGLLEQAREDWEEATSLDPTLAGAFARLSHLYARVHERNLAVMAAQRAYDEDAYLEEADNVLWRLVLIHHDLGSLEQSRRWCNEGADRFPEDHRFARCRLLLMTTEVEDPDPDRAWELAERVDSLVPEGLEARDYPVSLTHVAGVLARAGLPDSADAVLTRVRARVEEGEAHPDALTREAAMRANTLDDLDGAVEVLERSVAMDPDLQLSDHWWWRELRGHPGFERLDLLRSPH